MIRKWYFFYILYFGVRRSKITFQVQTQSGLLTRTHQKSKLFMPQKNQPLYLLNGLKLLLKKLTSMMSESLWGFKSVKEEKCLVSKSVRIAESPKSITRRQTCRIRSCWNQLSSVFHITVNWEAAVKDETIQNVNIPGVCCWVCLWLDEPKYNFDHSKKHLLVYQSRIIERNELQAAAVFCLYSFLITLLLSGPVLQHAHVKEQNNLVKQEDIRAGFGGILTTHWYESRFQSMQM